MSNIIPLNNQQHADLKINDSNDFSRFKEQHLVPISAHEFMPLSSEFAIAFVKNEETGQFTPVAMMGIKTGLNLYCQTSNWSPSVTPTGFYNAPLALVKQHDDEDNCMVCIDTNSPLVTKTQGQALFETNGEQSDYLKTRTNHLLDIMEKLEQTQRITQHLASKKLLVLKTLNINLGNDEKYTLNGLYVINEKALNELDKSDFNDLRLKGLLPLIYAHLSSMHQIARLAKKQIQFDNK